MKRLLLATVFSTAGFAAVAADLPAYSPAPYYAPTPMFTWTGIYAGANAGFGFGHFTNEGSYYFGNPSGGLGGVQIGYNYQSGPLVTGVEADLDFGSVSAGSSPYYGVQANGTINGEGSVRARFGYAFNQTLIYITGGYTGANLKGSVTDYSVSPNIYGSESTFLNGWTIGTGVEFMMTRNISVKAEYMFSDYGNGSLFASTPDSIHPGLTLSTLRAGINYHF